MQTVIRWLPLCLLVSCAELIQPVANVNFLSIEQERELAQRFSAQVESEATVIRDTDPARYVTGLGDRLVAGLPDPAFAYRFRMIENPEVNAFNIGGGYVYVHTGLIAAARTEGQLVSVMAHEVGHQVRRHVAKALSRQQLFQTLASVAIGENASAWLELAAGLGITTGQLHFSREAEREADAVMVDLMIAAGYDPREALGMFEVLRAMDRGEPGKVAAIFSSHPPTSERLENVRSLIASRDLPGGLVRDSERFHRIRRQLPGEG